LEPSEAKHGLWVLRLKEGAAVTLASPWGLAPAVVLRADRKNLVLTLRLTGAFVVDDFKGPTLVLPLIRPSRFDWAVEKAVELGARQLWPLMTARVRSTDPSDHKLSRWRRLAEEARKQCARSTPLTIEDILDWPGFLAQAAAFTGPRLVLSPQGGSWPVLEAEPLILIGPEGGLADQELAAASALGFIPISLGPRILRVETAALAALAQWAVLSQLNS
jgi:16S rRNA (uracil1498-N3)-methyltransferase